MTPTPTAEGRAAEIIDARYDEWHTEGYVWDGEDEYPEVSADTDKLQRMIAAAIRDAETAAREQGRREGLEEAATTIEGFAGASPDGTISYYGEGLAQAIRRLARPTPAGEG